MYLLNIVFSKLYFRCIVPFCFPQEPIFIHEITAPNMISTFWQLPQIMIITAGEILFSITSLKFAFSQVSQLFLKLHPIINYTFKIPCSLIVLSKDCDIVKMYHFLLQAPESMKAVIMAISLMTNAIGNIITLLITEAFKDIFGPDELVSWKFFKSHTYDQYMVTY